MVPIYVSLILFLAGCGPLMEAVLKNSFVKNPEDVRQKEETKRESTTQENLLKADTEKKVEAIAKIHEVTLRKSHPSFFSSVVSIVYTEEGRRLAGMAALVLGSLIALGVKTASTWGLPGMLATAVRNIQDIKEQHPKGSPERQKINDLLKQRQERAGVWIQMNRRMKKILGED